MYRIRGRGMGQTSDPLGIRNLPPQAQSAPSPSYPWYCDFVPSLFASQSMAASCGVPTQQQQDARVYADIQKAAGFGTPSYNPQLAGEQYSAYKADIAAYCADPANAANCAAFQQAQPGALLALPGTIIGGSSGLSTVALIALGLVAGGFILFASGGRKGYRYVR